MHGGCGSQSNTRRSAEGQAELRLHSPSPLGKLLVPMLGRPALGRAKTPRPPSRDPGDGLRAARGRCVPGRGARPRVKCRPAGAEQGEGAAAASSLLPRTTRTGKLSGQGEIEGERDGGLHSSPAAPRPKLPEGAESAGTCRERSACAGPTSHYGYPQKGAPESSFPMSVSNNHLKRLNFLMHALTLVLNFSLRRGL